MTPLERLREMIVRPEKMDLSAALPIIYEALAQQEALLERLIERHDEVVATVNHNADTLSRLLGRSS